MQWIAAFVVSFAFIWVAGFVFCNSLLYVEFDKTLNKFVHAHGLTYRHRSEGVATTTKGRFGINAIEDIRDYKQEKLVVWGDSFVEAHQVDDPLKIPQRVTQRLVERGLGDKAMAFAVGMSGDSVADYYFDLPKYEKLTRNIKAHYIVITDVRDTLPDQADDTIRGVFTSHPFRLSFVESPPKFQGIKKRLNSLGLYFLWEPARSAMRSIKNLKLVPSLPQNTFSKVSSENKPSPAFQKQAWTFLFEKLKQQTRLPLVFVVCPTIPFIENGSIVTTDPHADEVAAFADLARKAGISVVNLSGRFLEFYQKTGQFPRGFPNSKPGEGHFNRFGHDLVAEAITEHALREGIL